MQIGTMMIQKRQAKKAARRAKKQAIAMELAAQREAEAAAKFAREERIREVANAARTGKLTIPGAKPGIPSWVWYAGGAAVAGGVAYLALK